MTGATSGIGLAATRRAGETLNAAGRRTIAVTRDVSDEAQAAASSSCPAGPPITRPSAA